MPRPSSKIPKRHSAVPNRPSPPRASILPALLATAFGAATTYGVMIACGKSAEPPQPMRSPAATASPGDSIEPLQPLAKGLVDPTHGGASNLVEIPGESDAGADGGRYNGPMLGAAHFQTHVFERPDYSSARIGYLRAGAKVGILGGVTGEPVKRIKTPSCKEGWVAIQPRGYVCLEKGGGALNLEQPNVRLATAPPNFDDLLPYKYAFNWRMGDPLYRKVPTPKEWGDKEPWLRAPPKRDKPKIDKKFAEKSAAPGEGDESKDAIATTDDASIGATISDSGLATVRATDKPDEDEASAETADASVAAVEDAASLPWWERDAGKGSISLKDTIEGEGLVARRMAKGFAIAIDRTFTWSGRVWHRTTMGLIAAADSVSIVKAPEFKGVELGGELQLPVAWSLIKEAGIFESKDNKTFSIKDRLKRQTPIRLASPTTAGYEEIKVGASTYIPTFDGRFVRANDVARIDVATPPADLKPGEKWIDVSIRSQALVAYEGDKPVFATLVSTGRDGTNTKGDFATVQGTFRVREKHVAATMDGDTSGELYSIDDVPYIQYFHTSYALHGAFWHSDFGRVRSHGCVNLSPADAKRLFFWTEPRLPDGWHAVWATESDPGTRIVTRP